MRALLIIVLRDIRLQFASDEHTAPERRRFSEEYCFELSLVILHVTKCYKYAHGHSEINTGMMCSAVDKEIMSKRTPKYD